MQIGSNIYSLGNSYADIQHSKGETHPTDDEKASQEKRSHKDQKKEELSEDEKSLIKDLSARDSEVRTHESAHQAAGGGMTGAASFSYQQGPDGRMYAIGGEVSIASPSGSTPDETIKNARQVVAAAMAPADPSSQDFAVASSARMVEMHALQQKAKEMQEKREGYAEYAKSSNEDKENQYIDTERDSLDISA